MKKKYILSFNQDSVNKPVTYDLIKNFDIKINIIKANISADEAGHLLVEMEADQANMEKCFQYLDENQVEYVPAENRIIFDQEKCVDCGSCTAVCFAEALTLDPDTRELQFHPEKCVFCKLCTKACPLGLFEIKFNE